jgi:ABC-2 type transport system ATP-binding protein
VGSAIDPHAQGMIEIEHISKRYGEKLAVDDISFVVKPGTVTGFLGPNGAGKSTTMRMIVGLDAPSGGTIRVNGAAYRDFQAPLHEVGAMLEARAIHTGRSAYNHLLAMAQTHGIGRARVEEVIEMVGLGSVARKRAGGFSLGMGQRLGIASALLGDPQTVILDEPANGLDPEGILWIRTLLKQLAAEGRTVFLSSHLMSEMAQTAEHLVIVGRGRVIADTTVEEVVSQASVGATVHVRSPQAPALRDALAGEGVRIQSRERETLEVHGLSAERIGELAAQRALILHELTPQRASLEDAYMRLTGDAVEYRTDVPVATDEILELAA